MNAERITEPAELEALEITAPPQDQEESRRMTEFLRELRAEWECTI